MSTSPSKLRVIPQVHLKGGASRGLFQWGLLFLDEWIGRIGARGRRLLPITPEVDIAEIKGVPPEIEHGLIETKNAFAGDAVGGRNERSEAIVDLGAFRSVSTREQMPESEAIIGTRLGEDNLQCGGADFGGGRGEIEINECGAEGFGG